MGELALVLAASVGVPCVLFYFLLRHWVFVVLALAPPVSVLTALVLLRGHGTDQALVASLFGTICALSLSDQLARGMSAGFHRGELITGTSRPTAFAAGSVLLSYFLFLCCEAVIVHDWRDPAAVGLLFLTAFFAAFAGHLFGALFPFSEHAIARANAGREWRERMFDRFFLAMPPRWAFSVTGIALVLSAVAGFGIRDAQVHWMAHAPLDCAAGLVFAFAAFAVVARDWRMTAALTLTTAFTGILVLWALARCNPLPDLSTVGAMVMLSSVPLSVIAARARLYAREGDDTASALAAAVRDDGVIAIALGAIICAAGLAVTAMSAVLSPVLVFAVASAFSALLLFPALTVAIYSLFPRYRTVDEVFGRR